MDQKNCGTWQMVFLNTTFSASLSAKEVFLLKPQIDNLEEQCLYQDCHGLIVSRSQIVQEHSGKELAIVTLVNFLLDGVGKHHCFLFWVAVGAHAQVVTHQCLVAA
jgi:hypothetical protein